MATATDMPAPAGDSETATLARHVVGRMLIYAALIFWAFVSLFPVYWTITTK